MSLINIQKPQRLALTAQETADALGLKYTTLWRLTQRGKIKANRSTRRPLYSITEIERFLNTDNQPTRKNKIKAKK
jgi:predicted site-specific integrase-resolvase